MRKIAFLTMCAIALAVSLFQAASADTTGSWMGKVQYINNRHIGVKAHAQTRDFVLDENTQFLENGKKIARSAITPGTSVTVSFTSSTLFGATRAISVQVNTFTLPLPTGT